MAFRAPDLPSAPLPEAETGEETGAPDRGRRYLGADMDLSNTQKRHLRTLSHHLKPVVRVGQHGLRDAVLDEIGHALDAHELIKVKLVAERDSRETMTAAICDATGATAIHSIGQVAVLFRRNPKKPRIALPSA
jgi:RNA-binding protein